MVYDACGGGWMVYKAIGAAIRKRRRGMDMTQEQLAEAVGVSVSFIGHIERGTRVMSLDTFVRICRALGCAFDDIIRNRE